MHDARLANLLGAAALTVADRLTAAAAKAAGASVSGTAALVTLLEADGIGVTALGQRIGLSQPAWARMLDQLAAHGLVVRAPGSGRSVALHLTAEGTAAARRAQRARHEELRGVLGTLATVLYLAASRYELMSVATVLASLYPAIPVLLALALLHERLTVRQSAGLLCAGTAISLIAVA